MFEFKLRPEFRKKLKNPDLFIKGQEKVYWGIIIAMIGVAMMGIMVFKDPAKSMNPAWLVYIGIILAFFGEFQKYRAK